MPHLTPNRKTHCSPSSVGVPLRKLPGRAGEGRAWAQDLCWVKPCLHSLTPSVLFPWQMVQCTKSGTQQRHKEIFTLQNWLLFSPDKDSSQGNTQCLHTQGGCTVPVLKILQPVQTAHLPWKKRKLLRSSQGEQNAMKDASHDYF